MKLKIHSMIEEEIFYPALEALVEHDGAKMLINDIESAEPDEEFPA